MSAAWMAPALLVALAVPAAAQDFAAPWPPAGGPAALLEHGASGADRGPVLELLATQWLGQPGLETRAAAVGAGWRSARAAVGLSATGDAAIGWTAAGLAAGVAHAAGGAAVRVVGRLDRAPDPGGRRPAGVEAGAGAWLAAAPALHLYAAAPQMWADGASPPLARGFVIGARAAGAETSAWLERESVRAPAAAFATHAAGVAWAPAGMRVALEARDRPLRGAATFALAAGPLEVAVRVESHPLAGETTQLGLRMARP